MVINIKRYKPLVILVFIAIASCITVYDTINNRNYSKKYNPGINQLHPNFIVYQYTPNELRLYFQLFPKEFAFSVSESDSTARAHVSLFFRVTKTYNSIEIVDSLTSDFTFKGKPRSQFIGYVPISLPDDEPYVLEVFVTDKVSKSVVSQVLQVKSRNSGTKNSFMFTTPHASPLFNNFITVTDTFRLRTNMFSNDAISVQRILADTILPLPPDITRGFIGYDELQNDSLWQIAEPDTTLLSYDEPGIYVFSNEKLKVHRAVGVFNEYFPYVKTPEELLKPLAYLNTPREMEKLLGIGGAKHAVDSFWIEATNDLGKARELIRIYYNRVQLANYYFTSIKEGWRTDRGMVYIVFGMPSVVTIDKDGETWVYGKVTDGDLQFYFYRDEHPLFGENYQLDRSEEYSRIWFNAISTWRSGRVFSINQ